MEDSMGYFGTGVSSFLGGTLEPRLARAGAVVHKLRWREGRWNLKERKKRLFVGNFCLRAVMIDLSPSPSFEEVRDLSVKSQ